MIERGEAVKMIRQQFNLVEREVKAGEFGETLNWADARVRQLVVVQQKLL